jgi:uncharacterized protein with PQ loop repeat
VSVAAVSLWLGWIAVVAGVASAVVQYRRVLVRGVQGVSLGTWLILAYMGVFWVVYGADVRSWVLVVGSALLLPLQLGIVARLDPGRHAGLLWRAALFVVAFGVAPALAWGWTAGVYGMGAAMVLTRVPQLWDLVRTPGSTGVSAGAWLVSAAGSTLWVGYYVGAHLWAALVGSALSAAASSVIAALAGWRHHHASVDRVREVVLPS